MKEIEDESGRADIEASINMEMALIKSTKSPKLFQPVYLDIQCVLFFKTCATLDPVDFVDRICKWIICNPEKKKTRYISRLTPMTLMGKATEKGLEELSIQVLSQHFNMNNYPHHKANEVVEVEKKAENFTVSLYFCGPRNELKHVDPRKTLSYCYSMQSDLLFETTAL